MTENELIHEYFEWMYNLVCNDSPSNKRYLKRSYRKLLSHLHDIEFIYLIDMDGNRAEDGIDLRYRFGYECGYSDHMIATYLDNKPCSVLEMLVALDIRCEEHITSDPDVGDVFGKWFWVMLENLDLDCMTDRAFDPDQVDSIIDIFLNRQYKRNGEGGLFTIDDCEYDLRSIDIWYQLMRYLDTVL